MKRTIKNYCRLPAIQINKNLFHQIIKRYASSGLGRWDDKFVNNELRLEIEDYWRTKISMPKFDESQPSSNKQKYYVLSMFPYPSGSLHMGHVRVYAISDSVSRFHKMRGKNVIQPMGWDAFGLPAENAALERNIDPKEWTDQNIANMKHQLNLMGCEFDWDREIATCDPTYYHWTQELFLKLFDRGLAYQNESFVNWDPVDKTVLADEQVNPNGRSWRSNAKVEKKLLKQWFVRTTAFAESLMDGLRDPTLVEWRDIIKIQRHWIGECSGTSIDFDLICDMPQKPRKFNLWTAKPELIKYAKFVAVSKDNFLAKAKIKSFDDITRQFLDAKVVNPFNNEELPIFYDSSIEFYNRRDNYLGIPCDSEVDAQFCHEEGINFNPEISLNEAEFDQKRLEVMKEARDRKIGGFLVSPSLHDWLISRQRYWGTPIPIIHCKNCGTVPVPRDQLPVTLPKITKADQKIPNLREAVDWLQTSCPKCGSPEAIREADTMDTFVDSSWYFMRYLDPKNSSEMCSADKAKKFLPVDLYIGGKEHAALHLYYARFVSHFLHSEGLVPTREPFVHLLVQGMVMGKSYRVHGTGKYLKSDEVEKVKKNFVEIGTGNPVVVTWKKMSKSKYNGVDPMDMLMKYGADTTRLIILADVAPTSSRNWSERTFPGIFNWQERLWMTVRQFLQSRKKAYEETPEQITDLEPIQDDNKYLFESRNYYIKGVTFNIIGSQQLSVGISKMQGLTNSLRKVKLRCLLASAEYELALATQIIMLAPLAPHFASELWSGFCSAPYYLVNNDPRIQRDKDVLQQEWPEIDMNYELDLDILVGGCTVDVLKIPRHISDKLTANEAWDLALQSNKYQEYVKDNKIVNYRLYTLPGLDKKLFIKVDTSVVGDLNPEPKESSHAN